MRKALLGPGQRSRRWRINWGGKIFCLALGEGYNGNVQVLNSTNDLGKTAPA